MRQPSTGTPSVSSSSEVAATSSSDLTPEETTSTCASESARRSADTSGGVGQPRCTPPSPPVAMNLIRAALQAASVPPTVVAPTTPCTTEAARSRGPSFRAVASNRPSSARREPDHELAVEHADRRRHGVRLAHGALGGEPDLDAFARREAVGDERRLERHDTAALVECGRHLVGEPDHGIAPSRAQQRAAAASPSSAPPTRKPAASASPAPVVSTTVAASAG